MKIIYVSDQEIDAIVGGAQQLRTPMYAIERVNFRPGLAGAGAHQEAKRHFNIRRFNRFFGGQFLYSND